MQHDWLVACLKTSNPEVRNAFMDQRINALLLWDAAYFSGRDVPKFLTSMYRLITNKHSQSGSGLLLRDILTDFQVICSEPRRYYAWHVYNCGTNITPIDDEGSTEWSSVAHHAKRGDEGNEGVFYLVDTLDDHWETSGLTEITPLQALAYIRKGVHHGEVE